MVDAALSISAEQVIEYSAYGKLLERAGNRGPTAAPQNLYRSADIDEFGRLDSWVAIAVATDDQWERLRKALGSPSWAADPKLAAAADRAAHHDLIDEHLAKWCEPRSRDEIVGALWDAGVPVAKVMQPHRQTELEQLAFRHFFEEVDHPVRGSPPDPAGFIPGTRRCWASTTMSCCPIWACPRQRSRIWKPMESSAARPRDTPRTSRVSGTSFRGGLRHPPPRPALRAGV
jgi:crotonobetainyl-CoA:carnitine CoA-transferase CaiB-like acyl-CoA transferase